ncbi:DUF350 domain-containing protein [Vallicoccus soli]|uniref:DUF350 domain-containing protein n=1 Tax=Vallicoccus soli TaxID=2339232 RepID=A0A3A3YVD2_9ACTN|nr:DUF350 domain-containing protein [Vallicoccus soli]RJK94184.1 DUF350 domain-containing protein [Vallicoccus soli]
MLESLGYGAAYTLVGIALLAVGFVVLDLLTPGHLGRHIYEDRSVNAGIVASGGFLSLGAVLFTAIWTNADSGFGEALGYTVAFGALGIVLQAVAFLVLDVLTPGKLGELVTERHFHPASLVTAASQLSVAAIIAASIA